MPKKKPRAPLGTRADVVREINESIANSPLVTVSDGKLLDGVYSASSWPDELVLPSDPDAPHMLVVELFGKRWTTFGGDKLIFAASAGEQVSYELVEERGEEILYMCPVGKMNKRAFKTIAEAELYEEAWKAKAVFVRLQGGYAIQLPGENVVKTYARIDEHARLLSSGARVSI